MNGINVKFTIFSLFLIVFLISGAIGFFACGYIGASCQSEQASQVQKTAFFIAIPTLVIFVIVLILPEKIFGKIEK